MSLAQKISVPFFAKFALQYARSPKRIGKWAAFINVRVNLPYLTEEQEQKLYEETLGTVLDTVINVLDGQPILTAISQRDTVRDAMLFFRSALVDAQGNPEFDIPFLPQWIERPALEELLEFIDEHALPWVETTPRLQ